MLQNPPADVPLDVPFLKRVKSTFTFRELFDMLGSLSGEDLVWALKMRSYWELRYVNTSGGRPNQERMKQPIVGDIQEDGAWRDLERLQLAYERLGAKGAARQIETVMNSLMGGNSWETIRAQLHQAIESFRYEVGDWECITVAAEEANAWRVPALLGNEVQARFPNANAEIISAARCLSMDLWNASAFHSLRAAECALQACKVCFSLTPSDSTWGGVLSALKKALPVPSRSQSDKETFGWALHSQLIQMKAIRDKRVMHVDEPPCDMDTARKLYSRISDFLLESAKHLDESGTFLP